LIHDHPNCGKCHAPLAAVPFYDSPVTLTDQTFDQEILQFPGPSLVDFYSNSCGYCTLLDPILDQLAAEHAGRLKIGKINIEHSPMTASRFEVMSTPTMILFKEGRQVNKLLGALPKEEIEDHLKNVLG
jgi:thioredoxin 2